MRKLAAAMLIGTVIGGCSGGSDDTGSPPSSSVQTRTVAVGDKVPLADGNAVWVHGYQGNASPSNQFSQARPGTTFGVVDVEACAGPQGSQEGLVNPFDFRLVMPDGGRVQSSIPVKDPPLGVVPLAAGRCTRGYVTYEVAAGVTPAAVVFERSGVTVQWNLP